MLRPGHRVRERRRPVTPRVLQERLGDLLELRLRAAGDLLDDLGRVPTEMPLHDLEDTPRVLKRGVALWRRLLQRADDIIPRERSRLWRRRPTWGLSRLGAL